MSEHLSQIDPVSDDALMAAEWGAGLTTAHREALRRLIARGLSGEGDEAVEDVLQEAVLALHDPRAVLPEAGRIGPWLRQVATHKVQDYWRRIQRRRRLQTRLSEHAEFITTPAISPYEWVVALESQGQLYAALDRLAPEDRALLEEKYLGGRSCEQIAATRGLSLKSLEYRLQRARQAIRKFLMHES